MKFRKNDNNNVWTYKGDFKVTEDMVIDGEMIKEKIPDIIKGRFECRNLGLTTLKNCPKEIYKDFNCSDNKISSLEFCPKIIKGSFECSYNKLTSLKGCPEETFSLYCRFNNLSNVMYSPKIIHKFFICDHNKITSLKNGPEIVKRTYSCNNNKLTNLDFKCGLYRRLDCSENTYPLKIEKEFIKQGFNDYWPDLLNYCVNNSINLEEIKGWPEGFLTEDIIKSFKGINKFGL